MRLFMPLAGLFLVAGGYTWFWTDAADRVETEFDRWVAAQEAAGVSVDHDGFDVSGFPFRLLATVDRPRLSGTDGETRWRWEGDGVRAHALPYKLNHVIVEAIGPQTLTRSRDTERGPETERVDATAGAARASLVWTDRTLDRIAVDIEDLDGQWRRALGTDIDASSEVHRETIRARRVQIHSLAGSGEETPSDPAEGRSDKRFSLIADDVTWADHAIPGLGDTLTRAEGRFVVLGIPDEAVADHGLLHTETLKAWREGKGQLRVDTLSVDWAPLRATAHGALTLDWRGRPQGRIELTMAEPNRFVSALAQGGIIDDSIAALTGSALTFLAALDGQPDGQVRLPLIMKNGKVYLGSAKIGKSASVLPDPVETPEPLKAGQE